MNWVPIGKNKWFGFKALIYRRFGTKTFWHLDVLALDVLAPRRFGTSKVNFSRRFGP